MSCNRESLLKVAAEMRSVGYTWDSIAEKVHRKTKTCQNWPQRYRDQWQPIFRDAQHRRFEDTSAEAHTHLRNLMRSDDDKTRLK